MAEDKIEHKPGITKDTSDSSTQTSGLDTDFFSCDVPPRLRWSSVATDNLGRRKEHDPAPTLEGVSPCRNVTLYPDQTPENDQHCDKFTRSQILKRGERNFLISNQALQNLTWSRDPTKGDVVPYQQFSPSCETSHIHDLYSGLHKVFLKPVFSYACLIAMALKHSPERRLPVNEIYNYLQWEFPYFRTAPEGWKNSVRHNLSLNKAFYKVDRSYRSATFPVIHPLPSTGKGCYWLIDPGKEEAMDEEILKWKRKHPEAVRASMANPANYWNLPNKGLSPAPDVYDTSLPPSQPRYIPYPHTLRSLVSSVEDPDSFLPFPRAAPPELQRPGVGENGETRCNDITQSISDNSAAAFSSDLMR
ncbi:hypothetical protein ACHWQZ_G003990 [Mnemiopsis leidyi]